MEGEITIDGDFLAVCGATLLVVLMAMALNGFSFGLKWLIVKLVGLVRRMTDDSL